MQLFGRAAERLLLFHKQERLLLTRPNGLKGLKWTQRLGRTEGANWLLSHCVCPVGHDVLLYDLLRNRIKEKVSRLVWAKWHKKREFYIKIPIRSTYIWLELSLQELAGLLADSRHGAVLVDLTSEFTSCIGGDLGDRATSCRGWHIQLS